MSVYIARTNDAPYAKIGWATNPEKRVQRLRAGSFLDLRLVRTMPGGRTEEAWMHKRFAEYRHDRDWFRFHPKMMTVTPPSDLLPQPTQFGGGITQLLSAWPTMTELGVDLGVSWQVPVKWRQRNSIPGEYWFDLVQSAERRGYQGITYETLALMHRRSA